MRTEGVKRKLTAILSADVKGYSRLMGEDEVETVRTLTASREVMTGVIQQFRGRVVDSPGDNVLAEFASVIDAVQCAVEIQRVFKARNAELPENRRMEFRIGVNLGDVIEEGERIYGDGVNIAARVEGLAEAGGICISGGAHEQIENKLPLRYEYLGEHKVKNIMKPVRVYRAQIEPEVRKERRTGPKRWQWATLVLIAVLVLGGLALWKFYFRPSAPQVEPASEDKTAFQLPEKPSIAVPPLLHGTWVNSDYNAIGKYAKMIFNPDGTWASYLMDSDPDPTRYGKFTITDKWNDPEGNVWFKERHHWQLRGPNYRLMKLTNSGKTLEIIMSPKNYPSELDLNNMYYGIYQRLVEQEELHGTRVVPD